MVDSLVDGLNEEIRSSIKSEEKDGAILYDIQNTYIDWSKFILAEKVRKFNEDPKNKYEFARL